MSHTTNFHETKKSLDIITAVTLAAMAQLADGEEDIIFRPKTIDGINEHHEVLKGLIASRMQDKIRSKGTLNV